MTKSSTNSSKPKVERNRPGTGKSSGKPKKADKPESKWKGYQFITDSDLPAGWYGMVVYTAFTSLEQAFPLAVRGDQQSLVEQIIDYLKGRDRGSVVVHSPKYESTGFLTLAELLKSGGVVGMGFRPEWRGDTPSDAYDKAVKGEAGLYGPSIVVRYLDLGAYQDGEATLH